MIPKKVEVIVSQGSSRSSYVTTHVRAEQARVTGELERSGELRRRELTRIAEQFNRQVFSLVSACPCGTDADDQFRDEVRTLAARVIPVQVEALERWVAQMPLLISALKKEVADRQRQATQRRAAEIVAQKEEARRQHIAILEASYGAPAKQALSALDRGLAPLIDEELAYELTRLVQHGILTDTQADRLRFARVQQSMLNEFEERYGDFADRNYRLTKEQRGAIEYRGQSRRGHVSRRDGDRYKDQRWNRRQGIL